MFWKILLTIGMLIMVWAFLFRVTGPLIRKKRRPAKPAKATIKAQDLIKCRRCGIYLPAGQPCRCQDRA